LHFIEHGKLAVKSALADREDGRGALGEVNAACPSRTVLQVAGTRSLLYK
jgi:hypothetical protein